MAQQQTPRLVRDDERQNPPRTSASRGLVRALLRRRELSIVLVTVAAAVYFGGELRLGVQHQ
jgi:hypothetical protein